MNPIWKYLLIFPCMLILLSGCGSSSDEEDLTALCPDTSTITDADEVLTEIIYTSVEESPDAGDLVSSATSVSKNNVISGSLTAVSDRWDYFTFAVNEGDELEIALSGDNGTNFDIILLKTSDESFIAQSLNSTSEDKILYTVASGITSLTVYVESVTNSTGNYTLTLTSYTDTTTIEPSSSELLGTITDASTGDVLVGASVKLRACGQTTGDVLVSDTSDSSGQYSIDITTGTYTAEVSFDGYTSEFTTIALVADEDAVKNFPLNEQLAAGETRIVLSWGATPRDLDSHLQVPKATSGTTEIYYGNRSEEGAALDLDATGGFGPETITISSANAGTYTYWVQDFSNRGSSSSTSLSNSGATVKVYNENGLAQTFNIPNSAGDKWNVFTMDGSTGTLTTVNTITTSAQ